MKEKIKVLVLGASGMLGNAVYRFLMGSHGFDVTGTVRSTAAFCKLPKSLSAHLISGVDVENMDCLIDLFVRSEPDVVINCVGLVKQHAEASTPLRAIPINSLLPHKLEMLCQLNDSRLIHISTDCVFSGIAGNYSENDFCDANDIYGRSKFLGEVDSPRSITLRTSIIGHELSTSHSLVGWFLDQENGVKGFRRAIFSGLPTVELARIIRDCVIPHPEMRGLYHVSSKPISKFELLKLIAQVYEKNIKVDADDSFVIDRSLNSSRFQVATGYKPVIWSELVKQMREFS